MTSLRRLREALETADVEEIAKRRRLSSARWRRKTWQRFAEDYPGMPHYPRAVAEFAERWLDGHLRAGWECSLAEAMHYLRRDARVRLGEDLADELNDRGVAKMVRALGLRTVKRNDGLWVFGLRPR